MPHKKAVFISDCHLGARHKTLNASRIHTICQFLRNQERTLQHLVLIGDIFEFWMEYKYYIPKIHFPFLYTLRHLTEAGVQVHYFSGNHDFNLGAFFSDDLHIITHHHSCVLKIQQKKCLIIHGDGLLPSDKKYRLLKKVLTHPLSNWAFRLIHPDYGMMLANRVSAISRTNRKTTKKSRYQEICKGLLSSDIDAVLFGHIHMPFIQPTPKGLVINTGDWIRHYSYIELFGGEFVLKTYDNSFYPNSA